jgi:hypothetical protein
MASKTKTTRPAPAGQACFGCQRWKRLGKGSPWGDCTHKGRALQALAGGCWAPTKHETDTCEQHEARA